MNRALLIACFAISTIALALSLVPRDVPPPPPPPEAVPMTADDFEIISRRLDALDDSTQELWTRVAALQRGVPAAAAVDSGAVPVALQAEVAQLRDEVHGMIAGEALNSEGGKQWLKDQLRDLQAEDRRARMEQQLARAAQREEEQKGQWKKFVSDAQLNYNQEQSLMRALDAESAKRTALMDEVRAGTKDFRDVMRDTRDLRRATDKEIMVTLDEAQARQYQQLRREQNRPRGDWGGGDARVRGGGGFPGRNEGWGDRRTQDRGR